MATVRKLRGRWVADYRDQHSKRHVEIPKGSFENAAQERLAAHALLAKRLGEVARGQHNPADWRLTFGDLCNRFLESKVNVRPTTLRSYRALIGLYLQPYFGKWKLQSVSAADIERFRFELSQGLPAPIIDAAIKRAQQANLKWSQGRAKLAAARQRKPGVRTINKALTVLTMVLNYACRHRWVDFNAAEHVERLRDSGTPSDRAVDDNILAPTEIRALVEAADDRYKLLIQVAVFTGVRQGELLGLQWGDIDWHSRQLHIRRAWKEGVFTEPKTKNSVRRVDLPEFLVTDLKGWRLRCPKGDLDLVFANAAGNPESHSNLLTRGFYPALRRAGLRKVRFHDLRHTFASLMLANGEDIVRVSRLLGHASPTVTLNVYSHMLPRAHYGSTDRLANLVYGKTSVTQLSTVQPANSQDGALPAAANDA